MRSLEEIYVMNGQEPNVPHDNKDWEGSPVGRAYLLATEGKKSQKNEDMKDIKDAA